MLAAAQEEEMQITTILLCASVVLPVVNLLQHLLIALTSFVAFVKSAKHDFRSKVNQNL